MKDKRKQIALCVIAVLAVIGLIVGVIFGSKTPSTDEKKMYQVEILKSAHGTVTASKLEAYEGEEIELTVTPDEGYELSSLTVNGKESDTTFKMPAEDVKILAKFALIENNEEVQGNNFGAVEGYVSTPGIDFSNDNGENPTISVIDGGPQYAYVKDVYNKQLMFEATFKVKDIFNEDKYPKFGIMLNGTTEMVKFYVDLRNDFTCESVGVVHQPTGGDDDWENAYTKAITKLNLANPQTRTVDKTRTANLIKLKVVRDNNGYYFYVNDVLVLCEKNALVDEETVVGVFSFNTALDVFGYRCVTGDEVKAEIAQAKKDSASLSGSFFGKADSFASSDVIDFSTDHGSNPYLVLDANKATPLYAYKNNFVAKDFYFETEIKVSDILGKEKFPKFGIMVNDDKEMVKFYLDMNQEKQVGQIGVVHQVNGKEDDWANQKISLLSKKVDLSKDTVKVAVLRNGTAYYFYIDGELILTGNDLSSKNTAVGVFSFGTTLTCSNYKFVSSGSEYDALLSAARNEAKELSNYKLTQNYFTQTDKGVYILNTDSANEGKVDDVMLNGSIFKETFYSVKGRLTLNAKEDWAQARILISADPKNEYVIALEQTGKNTYQIFAMSKKNEESWNDWRLISSAALNGDRNSIDFEVVVNKDILYLLIDDEICYSSSQVSMKESTIKFSGYKKATTKIENLDGQIFEGKSAVDAYIKTKSEKEYATEHENRINELYKEYITNNGCKGGTLLLGTSIIDFWDNWETQSGLTNYVNGYNVGIVGSTTKDWLHAYSRLVQPFKADRYVIALGEADVLGWGRDSAEVVQDLKSLFEKIHKDSPNTEIYYIYALPTPGVYKNGAYTNAKYEAFIKETKKLCETLDYVNPIDTSKVVAKEEFYREDKNNLNEKGYAAWSDFLYDILFKGEKFGVTVGDGVSYKTTNGIELFYDKGTNGIVDFFGKAPRYAYLNNVYADKFYFETDVHVSDLLEDDYPKFGLLINGKTEMVKFYLDVNKDNKNVGQVGVVHQLAGGNDDWANQAVQVLKDQIDLSQEIVTLGLLRDGKTYYFYVNDELVITANDLTAEKTAVGAFSFNVMMTLSGYQIVTEGNEYDELLEAAKQDAKEYWSYGLSTNYFVESEDGIYTLATNSADESKVDDIICAGKVVRNPFYRVSGTLTLSANEDWAQSRILISADPTHEYLIALEQTGNNTYQIFTMSKNGEESWNDWRQISSAALNKDRNSIDFEVVVKEDDVYFLIDDEICYSSTRVDMTESTVKFSGYKNATTTVENIVGEVYADEAFVTEYLATKDEKVYETEFQNRIDELYEDYITNHECDGGKGTLFMGSSVIELWHNWAVHSGLTNYVNTYNVGIAGTTVNDWLYAYDKLVSPFEPVRIVISLGEADVFAWGDSGEEVVAELRELFEKIHTDFPNTEIYYIYPLATPNEYKDGAYTNAKYKALVEGTKALCDSLSYVVGIDTAELFEETDFADNKTQLNENGYKVLGDHLYDQIFRGETFGVTVGDDVEYKTTDGIDLSKDRGENPFVTIYGVAPRYAYLHDVYTSKFYFETTVDLEGLLPDNYPKLGLFVNGQTEMVKFYLDINKDTKQVGQIGVVHQPTGGADLWGEQKVHTLENPLDLSQDSVKLALLRNDKTYYFYVNDVLVATADELTVENGAVGVFSFNAVMTLTDYSVVTEDDEYDDLLEDAVEDAAKYWSYQLTQNHFSEVADGKYELTTDSADEGKIDDIKRVGKILRERFYSIKGTLTLSANEDWAQSRILVSSDAKHEYVIALEQTGTNTYQIFTMSKNGEDNWNDWKLIESAAVNGNKNSIDFEVIINGNQFYFLVDNEICYSSTRVEMTESTVKFAGYKNATTTVENLDGEIFASEDEVNTYLATKAEKEYETEYEGQINALYQDYITDHGCANKGGTLLLGDSFANILEDWQVDTGLTNYADGYNVSIQGSITKDWLYAYDKLVKPFAAEKFVIALGNADIVTWNADKADVIARLAEIFAKIHNDFPTAEIYYIYAVPVSFMNEVNALCQSLDYVEGVYATEDIYGKIFAGENFGATVKNEVSFKTTQGISLKNDKGNNPTLDIWGAGQLFAYLNDTYTKKAYFETEINVKEVLANDGYPKFGLMLQGKSEKVSFFVDMTPSKTANTVGVVRQKTGEDYDWANSRSVNVGDLSFTGTDTVKLAIVRDGRDYYFYVNNTLVLFEKDGLYNENGTIGIFSFNTVLTASNYNVYTGNAADTYIANAKKEVNFFGSANGLHTTDGVDLSGDYGANVGKVVVNTGGPKHLYVKNSYFADYYFETKIHVNEIYNNEEWPKFGLFAEDGSTRISFFVDMKTDKTSGTVGRVISTHNGTNWSDDWGGSRSVAVEGMNFSGTDEYVTLGLKKEGNRFFFYVNGSYAMSYDCDALSGKTTVGAFGFNTGMKLKDYFINQVEGIKSMVTLKTEGSFGTVKKGEEIWTNKTHTFYEMPSAFLGETYIKNEMKTEIQFDVKKSGYMYVLTPPRGQSNSVADKLDQMLYDRIETPSWYFASYSTKRDTWVYERKVERGETITLPSGDYWHIVVVSELPLDPTVHEIGDIVFANSELAVLEPTEASGGTIGTIRYKEYPFTNRGPGASTPAYLNRYPYCMQGQSYVADKLSDTVSATVTKAGKILLLGSTSDERKAFFEGEGFTYIGSIKEEYSDLIEGGSYSGKGYGLYIKDVAEGAFEIARSNWSIVMFQATETLPPEPPLSIEITQMPDKTVYQVGDTFDATGLVVMGTDKYGNKRELNASEYVTVPTTFTTDVYAASVIVNDLVAPIPLTFVDAEGKTLVDNNDYSRDKYTTQKAPLLNGSIKRGTVDEVIAAIKKLEADGATAFNVHLTELKAEYRNYDSFKRIADCTKYPVMAIAYGGVSNQDDRIFWMKEAVRAGFDIVDLRMDTYEDDARATLAGTVFESANPVEVSMDPVIIEQQKALVQEFKDLGAEVLMSAHVGVSLTEAEGLALAKEMEARGADVAKIVLGSSANDMQEEVMQTNLTLKKELNIKFYYNATGTASKPYRKASALLGTHMIFCYAEEHSSNVGFYEYVKDLKEFYKTIPGLVEPDPIIETNNTATVQTVALGKTIWTNKDYVFTSLPKDFIGKTYVKAAYSGSEAVDVTVVRPGYLYVITNAYKQSNSQGETVEALNYSKVDIPGWRFCDFSSSSIDGYTWVYEKYVEPGETLQLGQWCVVIASEERVDFSMSEDYIVPDAEMAVVESLSDQPLGTLEVGAEVFCGGTSEDYYFYGIPYWLAGKNYISSNYKDGGSLKVTRAGVLYMLANATDSRKTYFEGLGFKKVETPEFEPFGGSFKTNGFALYKKQVEKGEEITWNKWAIPVYSGEFILSDNLAMIKADSETTLTSKWEYHTRLFNDRNFYEIGGSPEALYGLSYLYAGIDNDGGSTAKGTVTKAGTIYVQIPVKSDNSTYKALQTQLIADGFTQTPYRIYRNNERLGYAQRLYQKEVQVGDVINYGKYHFVFFETLENEADYYVMPSLTTGATIINNPMNNANYVNNFAERNWQGCPVITRTNGGRLWAGWFTGGVTELATGNHAVLLYSDDDGKTWVDPAVAIVPSDMAYQVTKPQVWTLEDGRLWVSWTQHTGTSGFDGRMGTWAAICENPDANPDDLIWSEPIRLFDGRGNGKITVLKKNDGTEEWLTTAFDWMDRNYSKVYSSMDKGQTWTFKGMAEVTGSTYNNAILVERKDANGNSYLWMLLRQLEGNMKESFSYDGGKTWTNATKSHIEHPNSAIYVGYTSSGKLLMINHKDFTGRNNLTAFLSEDGGLTWDYSLLLDERSGVSYPDVVEGSDGTFYIVYDYDRFKTGQMYMTTITEEDIMAGDYVSAVAEKKILFSSLGINGAQVPDSLEKIDLTGKNSWASSGSGSGTDSAFDGNTDTRWCASDATLPQWLTIDLGQVYDLGAIYIFFEQRSEWNYTLEVSMDGDNWEVYAKPGSKKLVDVTELKDAQARYVRLTVNGTSGGAWASIWEMEIYSK